MSAEALAAIDRRAVARALAELPEPTRRAIVLVDICGLSAREAAEIEGAPRGTILSRVHRGAASWPCSSSGRACAVAHDDPRLVGYLAGELALADNERFEAHLVGCDSCWSAVSQDRRGRALAESLRELAPAALRDRVRMEVEASGPMPATVVRSGRRRHRRGAAAALALLALVGAATWASTLDRHPAEPAAVAAVVHAAHDPTPPASMVVRGRTVALIRDSLDGRQVTLAVSEEPFAMPAAARTLGDEPGSARTVQRGQMTVVCLSRPQNLLVAAELPAERLLAWATRASSHDDQHPVSDLTPVAAAGAARVPAPLVSLMEAGQAPLLARPYFADGDPGPIVAALATVPELLVVTAPFLGAVLGPGAIATRTKEIVILRTSAQAACRYCVDAHTVVARDAGLSLVEVRCLRGEADPADAFADPAERAVIAWCDALVGAGPVTEEASAPLRAAFADHEVVELTLVAATTLLLNRFCTALGLPTSPEVLGRLAAEGLG